MLRSIFLTLHRHLASCKTTDYAQTYCDSGLRI